MNGALTETKPAGGETKTAGGETKTAAGETKPPRMEYLPIAKVIPTPDNPRQIDEKADDIRDLAAEIKQMGVLEPVLVRPHPKRPGCYDLRAGERRLVASRLAGLDIILAIIREMTDEVALKVTVVENLQREDLTPIEEARGVQRLLDAGYEIAAIAADLGRPASWVVRRAQLTQLSPTWVKALNNAKDNCALAHWSAAHLEIIARLPAETQDLLAKDHGSRRMLSVHELSRLVGGYTMELVKASWKLDDAALEPKAGSCTQCNKRSSCRPGLFDELGADEEKIKRNDRCLDKACWDRKDAAQLRAKHAELVAEHRKVQGVYDAWNGNSRDRAGLPGVAHYNVEQCKQGDKGATCCLWIDGPKRGQTFWAHTSGEAERARTASQKDKPAAKPRSFAMRKRELFLRREALVNRALAEIVEEQKDAWSKVGLTEDQCIRLVAIFGTDERNDSTLFGHNHEDWDAYHKTADRKRMICSLWEQVYPVLVQRLNFQPPLAHVPVREHEELAKLLKIDLAKLRADAEKEIPTPKSWANLKADGTPKNSPVAKPAKKATGKKAESKAEAAS